MTITLFFSDEITHAYDDTIHVYPVLLYASSTVFCFPFPAYFSRETRSTLFKKSLSFVQVLCRFHPTSLCTIKAESNIISLPNRDQILRESNFN